jgi:hypothetical protein
VNRTEEWRNVMKRWVRILLIVIVALPVVLTAAAVKIFGLRTFVGPRKRDLTIRSFEGTSARLDAGSIW